MTAPAPPFILAVDAGNSRIKFGLFRRAEGPRELPPSVQFTAVPVVRELPWERLRGWPQLAEAASVVAGSNPAAMETVLREWSQLPLPPPLVIRDRTRLPLVVDVDFPEKVGIDRLLNAVAANAVRPADRPAIVVDCGTATTVDFVNADGAFAGGAILPGFELSARALNRYTALLPLLSRQDLGGEPQPLGRSTRDAIRSGLFWGQIGAVKELVQRLTESTEREPLLLLTGGGARLLSPHLPGSRWEAALPMQGLVLAAQALERDDVG